MLALAITLPFLALPNSAAPGTPVPEVSDAGPCRSIAARGRGLDRAFHSGVFRIRYAVQGRDAVADRTDANRDGAPDVIDDLARQLDAARDYYVHTLGLAPPLSQPRYGLVGGIDVLVMPLGGKNGLSFDEAVREPGEHGCKLLIEIDTGLQPAANPTAAHELFHLFQYGYAMFKVPWYLEGMARWIEDIFVEPHHRGSAAAPSPVRCETVLNRSYDAAPFWRALAARASHENGNPTSRPPSERRYTNNRPIIANDRFPGSIVLPVLESMQKASFRSSTSQTRFDWREDMQKSHLFDRRMCRSIESAVEASK